MIAGLVLIRPVAAGAGGNGAQAFDAGDKGELAKALILIVLVEDKSVALPAQGIEAGPAAEMHEGSELVIIAGAATVRLIRAISPGVKWMSPLIIASGC